jgi:hypothetical protein
MLDEPRKVEICLDSVAVAVPACELACGFVEEAP